MRLSNCSDPIPPRAHHFFFGCLSLLITLFLPWPALINYCKWLQFSVPRPFLSYTLSLWSVCVWEGGVRTIWPAHYRNRKVPPTKGVPVVPHSLIVWFFMNLNICLDRPCCMVNDLIDTIQLHFCIVLGIFEIKTLFYSWYLSKDNVVAQWKNTFLLLHP